MIQSITIYSFSFFISLIMAHIYSKKAKLENNIKKGWRNFLWITLIIIPIVLVSGFRYGVGTDFFNYEDIYDIIHVLSLHEVLTGANGYARFTNEPIFAIIAKFASFVFNGNELGFFVVSSFFTYFFIVKTLIFFEKYVPMVFGLFISYMIHFSLGLNAVRQMMALAVVFFSFQYLFLRKPLPFFVTIIIATLIHNTAIIGIVFYGFTNWNITFKKYNIEKIILKTYIGIIILSPLLMYLVVKIFSVTPLFNHYLKYLRSDINFGFGVLLFLLPFLVPLFLFRKDLFKSFPELSPFFYLAFLNIPIRYLGYIIDFGSRMAHYTELTYYIIIPALVLSIKDLKHRKILLVYYIVLCIVFYIYYSIIKGTNEVFPYVFRF